MRLLSHNTWNPDLVVGLPSFDSAELFTLLKLQSLDCFKQFFKTFGDTNWVSEDMQSTFKDCYVELVDELRYVYVNDSGRGPEVEHRITFLSRCRELERRRHTKKLVELCCLCLSHSTINIPHAVLGSASRNVVAPELSCVNLPLQYYLLSFSQDCSFSTRGESVSRCCEHLETFGRTALLRNYDPWGFVDFHRRKTIYSELAKRCKSVHERVNHNCPLLLVHHPPPLFSLFRIRSLQSAHKLILIKQVNLFERRN